MMIDKDLILNAKGGFSLTNYEFKATKKKEQLVALTQVIFNSNYNPVRLADILSAVREAKKYFRFTLYFARTKHYN